MLDWMRYLDLDPCLASNPPWTMACNAHVVGRSLLENKVSYRLLGMTTGTNSLGITNPNPHPPEKNRTR